MDTLYNISVSAEALPRVVKVDNTMGALFIGVQLSMGLWGACCMQAYSFFDRYRKDAYMKTLVFFVWALDTAHQALICHGVYRYLISEYANVTFLASVVPTLLIELILTPIVGLLVQSYLVFRIWKLASRKEEFRGVGGIILTSVLSTLVLANFVISIVYFIKAYPQKTIEGLLSILTISRAANIVQFVSIITISVTLTLLLYFPRHSSATKGTNGEQVLFVILNTGVLLCLSSLFSVIMIYAYPQSLIFFVFYLLTSRLYANTLLATLNARHISRTGRPLDTDEVVSTQSRSWRGNRGLELQERPTVQMLGKKSVNRQLSIKVTAETEWDDGLNRQYAAAKAGSITSGINDSEPESFLRMKPDSS